jgi:S1-C subfamily serine protease
MNLSRTFALASLGAAVLLTPLAAQAQTETPRARAEARATERGWLGFTIQGAGTGEAAGEARVQEVYPGSPAERAGVRAGDVVLRWNGRQDVTRALMDQRPAPGDTVRLRIRRDGRDRDLAVVAGARPQQMVEVRRGESGERIVTVRPGEISREIRIHADSLAVHADSLHRRLRVMLRDSLGPRLRELEEMELPNLRIRLEQADSLIALELGNGRALAFDLGLGGRAVAGAEFTEVNPGLGSYFGTDRGLLTVRVAPETPAARAGLQEGDVIVRAGDQPIATVRDLRQVVARAQTREVDVEVLRRGSRTALRLSWDR